MGCCSSKKKKNVTEPKQIKNETETLQEHDEEVQVTQRKNVQIKSNLDRDTNQEKPVKVGINPLELSKRRAEQEKKILIKEESKPKLSGAEHAKLLAIVEKNYKNFLSLLVLLRDNLMENETEEEETLGDIIGGIQECAQVIEKHLENLKLYPFTKDKERLQEYAKAVNFSKILNMEYLSYKKGTQKYPRFRKKILNLLQEYYPHLFEAQQEEEEVPLPEYDQPHSERTKRSPIKNTSPKKLTPYDIAFDREMAIVMQREKDNAQFELENAVNEYNRLIEDLSRLKQKDQNLKHDVLQVRQEVKQLKNTNNDLAYTNEMLGVENETFKNIQGDMLGNIDLTKESCIQLQNDLDNLHKFAQQNYLEKHQTSHDYQSKIRELENRAFERRREANELERRYQEDLRRFFNKEDEIHYQKSRILDQMDGGHLRSQNSISQFTVSRHFEPIYNPEYPRKSLAYELEQAQNPQYNNIIPEERYSKQSQSPRKSVLDQEGGHLKDVLSAVEQARKARVETDQSWVGNGLESKRMELYGGAPKENESRLSTLSGTLNSGIPKAYADGYYQDGNGYGGSSSYNQISYGYKNGGRESAYRLEVI